MESSNTAVLSCSVCGVPGNQMRVGLYSDGSVIKVPACQGCLLALPTVRELRERIKRLEETAATPQPKQPEAFEPSDDYAEWNAAIAEAAEEASNAGWAVPSNDVNYQIADAIRELRRS